MKNLPGIRVNTFSICAYDVKTGEAGVAVASRCMAVGGLVPYAKPGAGAIASQAFCNPVYGTEGLKLLSNGLSADEVIGLLVNEDVTVTQDEPRYRDLYAEEQMTEEGADFTINEETGEITWNTSRIRQLGIVDRRGNAAVHTGERTFDWAGSVIGDGFCCQGNLLAGEGVVADMAEAYKSNTGKTMVQRLMLALEAGEAAGGDKRGKQAAGILAVRDQGHWTGSDEYCSIRVDDHESPIAELKRILGKGEFL